MHVNLLFPMIIIIDFIFQKQNVSFFKWKWIRMILHALAIFHVEYTGGKWIVFYLFWKSFIDSILIFLVHHFNLPTYLQWSLSPKLSCKRFLLVLHSFSYHPLIIPKFHNLPFFLFSFNSFNFYFKPYRHEHCWHRPQRANYFCCVVWHSRFRNKV